MQPVATMARLAPAAAPLRMATQVLLLPLLNAADVAYNVVTLDHICEGRLDLGIGLAYHLQEVELGGITRQDQVPKEESGLAHVTCQFHNLPEDLSARLEYLEGFGAEVIQKLTG